MAAAANGKSLGLVACTAVVVGNTVGSGFYLSPSAVAPYGLLAILMWIVMGIGAICLGLVFARLDGAHASGTSVGIYETVAAMRVERVIAGEVRAFRRQRESTRNPDRR